MREIVIDTETTGLDPLDGHRVVEMGRLSKSTVPDTLADRAIVLDPSWCDWSDEITAVERPWMRPTRRGRPDAEMVA